MGIGRSSWRGRNRRRLLGALVGAALVSTVAPFAARAAVTNVACSGSGDIARVQTAVDAASSGDTIALSGTCDFTAAAPHGGDLTSIAATAVLIRPGSPVTNLTITSSGSPQSATILGSGTQTAFAIAAGNTGVTIRGLRFVNFARPIVVAGADNATIGSAGGLPTVNANRIIGQPTMNSAILAVATSAPMTIAYGPATGGGSAVVNAGALRNLTVQGNYISYAPPGFGAGDAAQVVAIDVRQRGTATIDGVDIVENAVGMFTSEFAMYSQNAIRVESLTAVPASAPPALADYRITNVEIRGNNLGRLEELDTVPGFRPGDVHAAGRAGIVVERVADFTVVGNGVRARLSATAGPVPGGGIVVSDSSFGRVIDNGVVVLADPATTSSDLGAVSVVDGVPTLFGDSSADQGTTDIEVAGNNVGLADADAPVGAQRGLVVSGADKITLHDNNVRTSSDAALHIGALVRGPGALASTGAELPRTTTRAVACRNLLDGEEDDIAEVSYATATPPSTGNAFPSGSVVGVPDNFDCPPELRLTPTHLTAGSALTASGRSWAGRTVTVTVEDGDGTTLTKSGLAADSGAYSMTFSATELGALDDGVLGVVTTAFDDSGFTMSSSERTATKDFVVDNPLAGTVRLEDGDGFTSNADIYLTIPAYWNAPSDPRVVSAEVWFADSNGAIPDGCGPSIVAPSGSGFLNQTCGNNLPEGTYTFNARWTASDGETSPVVSDSSIKDTTSPKPVILAPAQNSTVPSNNVTITGTAEPNSNLIVREGPTVITTTPVDSIGSWSVTITFDDGQHEINVYARDLAGNRSVASDIRRFAVNTTVSDTTPPDPPEHRSPTNGTLVPGTFKIVGYAEPEALIRVFEGATLVGVGGTDVVGNFSADTTLSNGVHTVVLRAYDSYGNESADSLPLTVDVDTNAPTAMFTSPASQSEDNVFLLETPPTFSGVASDDRGVTSVFVDYYDGAIDSTKKVAGQKADCPACVGQNVSWSVTPPATLLPGIYYAVVYSFDVVGNRSNFDYVRFTKIG